MGSGDTGPGVSTTGCGWEVAGTGSGDTGPGVTASTGCGWGVAGIGSGDTGPGVTATSGCGWEVAGIGSGDTGPGVTTATGSGEGEMGTAVAGVEGVGAIGCEVGLGGNSTGDWVDRVGNNRREKQKQISTFRYDMFDAASTPVQVDYTHFYSTRLRSAGSPHFTLQPRASLPRATWVVSIQFRAPARPPAPPPYQESVFVLHFPWASLSGVSSAVDISYRFV